MEYGETISRTGSMLVRADASVSISQNGIDWVPVDTVEGALQYVVGSAGRISVSVNGREVFFFTVVFAADFEFNLNNMRQQSGADVLEVKNGGFSYNQSRFLEGTDNLVFTVRPTSMAPADVRLLDTSCNQEVSVSARVSNDLVVFEVGNIDTSTYLQFFVGNVLLGFLSHVN